MSFLISFEYHTQYLISYLISFEYHLNIYHDLIYPFTSVDGRNPANHLGCVQYNPVNNEINYQPQLVRRTSSINNTPVILAEPIDPNFHLETYPSSWYFVGRYFSHQQYSLEVSQLAPENARHPKKESHLSNFNPPFFQIASCLNFGAVSFSDGTNNCNTHFTPQYHG